MKQAIVPYKRNSDPTAWQLYKREHPGWSTGKRATNYFVLNVSLMALILGGIYAAQHLSAFVIVAIPLLGLYGFSRSK